MLKERVCHKFAALSLGIYCDHFQAFLWLLEPEQDVAKMSAVVALHQTKLGPKSLNVCIKAGGKSELSVCTFKQSVRGNSNRLQIEQNFVYMVLFQSQVSFNGVLFCRTH